MREDRQGRTEGEILQDLLGGIRDMVRPADDVRQSHVQIVGDDAEVVSRNSIGAQQNEVLNLTVGELDFAKDGVLKACYAGLGYRKTNRGGQTCRAIQGNPFGAQAAAAAIVHRRTACRSGRGATRFQLLFRTKTGVGVPGGDDFLGGRFVNVESLGLEERAFVPIKAQPGHPFEDPADHLFRGAFEVSIFDSKDERAADMPGEKPVKKRRPSTADMQVASRRWGEANSWC